MAEDKKRLTLEDFKQKKNELNQNLEHITGGTAVVESVRCDCLMICEMPPDCHQ